MGTSTRILTGTLGLGLSIFLPAAAPAAAPKTARTASSEASSSSANKPTSMGKDKGDIEAYLKRRVATIRAGNKTQNDFAVAESQLWQEFWSKVKDERELFEVRVAKQRLNVFESLDSLERSEHGKTIADFERMQSNVLRSFETTQKSRMTAFFSASSERSKAFAAGQEKDRAGFAEEAEAGWRELKSGFAPSAAPRR